MTSLRTCFLLAAISLMIGCQATPERRPVETFKRGPENTATAPIRDIAVLDPEWDEEAFAEGDKPLFPGEFLREQTRLFLIQAKNYAVPKSTWVDAHSNDSRKLGSDAKLSITVEQWDDTALQSRGVIYVGAKFSLVDAKSHALLWNYECSDWPISVDPPHGARAREANYKFAIRSMVRHALASLTKN